MKSKVHRYEAEGVVVEYDIVRCIHAAECVRGLPAVFDPDRKPWIEPGNAPGDAVLEVVTRCPTGALRAHTPGRPREEAPDDRNTARVVPDGPLYLRGRLELQVPDGETVDETRLALCRCGASGNKPLCDNAHLDIEFTDPATGLEPGFDDDATGDGPLVISFVENGPTIVEGPVAVIGADGEAVEGTGCAFCRCGHSATKPFCDGSHKRVGFEAAGTPRDRKPAG